MTIGFYFDSAEGVLEFFERVKLLQNDSEEARTRILIDMIKEGKDIKVFETKRSPDQIAKDYSKHGNVLYMKLNKGVENGIDSQ